MEFNVIWTKNNLTSYDKENEIAGERQSVTRDGFTPTTVYYRLCQVSTLHGELYTIPKSPITMWQSAQNLPGNICKLRGLNMAMRDFPYKSTHEHILGLKYHRLLSARQRRHRLHGFPSGPGISASLRKAYTRLKAAPPSVLSQQAVKLTLDHTIAYLLPKGHLHVLIEKNEESSAASTSAAST